MYKDCWYPITSNLLPKDNEDVQVTYIGYLDNKPYCDAFAYMEDGHWYWSETDTPVKVKITAWKYICDPYTGN